jgi:hypothetical protein
MVSGRSLEAGTASITGIFGAAVAISSLDNGIGWSAAGVDAGTFPFIIGLIILGGSIFNLVQGWLHARDTALGPSELKRLAALFVPAAIYVGMIPLIGMYVASIVTAVALYLIFELTFQVSLPRGALGGALGF